MAVSQYEPHLLCRKMGLNSLPVAFGPEVAKWITVGTIDVTQIAVAAYLAFGRHETVYAAVLTGLILPQVSTLLWQLDLWLFDWLLQLPACSSSCLRFPDRTSRSALRHFSLWYLCAADLLPVQILHSRSHQE